MLKNESTSEEGALTFTMEGQESEPYHSHVFCAPASGRDLAIERGHTTKLRTKLKLLKNHAIASVDSARTALISQNVRKKGNDAEGFVEENKLRNH